MSIKTFSRLYSDEFPPARHVEPAIVIGAGMKRCVRVKCASEGRLTEVSVIQQSGAAVAFTVDVFKSKFPFTPDTDIPVATLPADDLTLYRVIPTQSALAGTPVEFEDSYGFNFLNLDGTPTNNERYLYMLITPAPASPITTWNAIMTVSIEVQ